MVAISILTVGFLGIVGLLSRALALNRVVAANYTATYLAAEGIEITKNIVDGNIVQGQPWNAGGGVSSCGGSIEFGIDGCEADLDSLTLQPYSGQPLDFDSTSRIYDYGGGEIATSFRRRIVISLLGQNEIKVESQVAWISRGGGTSKVTLEDHFFNWR